MGPYPGTPQPSPVPTPTTPATFLYVTMGYKSGPLHDVSKKIVVIPEAITKYEIVQHPRTSQSRACAQCGWDPANVVVLARALALATRWISVPFIARFICINNHYTNVVVRLGARGNTFEGVLEHPKHPHWLYATVLLHAKDADETTTA